MSQTIPEWLLKKTFVVEHNPNCPVPVLVRLAGAGRGRIDHKPPSETQDARGYGQTVVEAAQNALAARRLAK